MLGSISGYNCHFFFFPLLAVWRNRRCLTPGPRGCGIPPGWSYHWWGDRQQTFAWGSQPWGTETPPVCCIMWLWSVSFGYLISAAQAAKVLPSSWFLGKQRCWNTGVELSKSEWRHESTCGKVIVMYLLDIKWWWQKIVLNLQLY